MNIFQINKSQKYDKGLIALTCKEFSQSNKKLMRKWENGYRTKKKKNSHTKIKEEERKEKTVTKHEKIKLDLTHTEELITNSPVVSLCLSEV